MKGYVIEVILNALATPNDDASKAAARRLKPRRGPKGVLADLRRPRSDRSRFSEVA